MSNINYYFNGPKMSTSSNNNINAELIPVILLPHARNAQKCFTLHNQASSRSLLSALLRSNSGFKNSVQLDDSFISQD